jgi:hypothetical protein
MQVLREHIIVMSEGHRLSAFVHRPDGGNSTYPAVLMLHGLMGSKNQPHRMFVDVADQLAENGLVALRVDLRGRGDSEGNSIDVTPSSDMADVQATLNHLMGLPYIDDNRIGVIGLSWGGTLAALLAARDSRIKATVLWSSFPQTHYAWNPPMNDYDGRQATEMWGYLLGKAFYDHVQQVDSLTPLKTTRSRVLIVYGTNDDMTPVDGVKGAISVLREADVDVEAIPIQDADHVFMRYTWRQAAVDVVTKWVIDGC